MNEPENVDPENVDLGGLIADAADDDDAVTAEKIIRSGAFVVLQQIEEEGVQAPDEDSDQFSVVLAEVEEELAVVCFSNAESVPAFIEHIAEDIPVGGDLPPVLLDGNDLLDGLPGDCGLLLNPGTDTECYFPPGCLENDDEVDED